MNPTDNTTASELELHALKDVRLVYRGCSAAFAAWLNRSAVDDVIGHTDQQLLEPELAKLRIAEEQLVLRDSLPSVTERAAPQGTCLLRLPLLDQEKTQGLDLVLVESGRLSAHLYQHFFRSTTESAIRQKLVVFDSENLLFKSSNVAEDKVTHALIERVKEQLAGRVLEWLCDKASAPSTRLHSGYLQNSNSGNTVEQVRWCLLYWGSHPAIAILLSDQVSDQSPVMNQPESRSLSSSYRELVEQSATGLMVVREGVPLLANDSAARLLGFIDAEQLVQHTNFVDFVPEYLKEYFSSETNDAIQLPHRDEGEWHSLTDQSKYLMSYWQHIEWENQTCVCIALADISHRYRAEQNQRRNQRRFQDFAEMAADFFWELDTSLKFNFVSHRFENVLQIAPKNVLGLSIRQFYERYFPQPAPPQWRRHLQALSDHKAEREFEYRWTRADGKECVIVHTCQPLFDSQGNFEGYRGVGRDVTQDRALAAQVQFHATHDALTSLVNRREFERLLEEALHDTDSNQRHALCYVDLDNFKIVNDTCGHSAGDELLRQLGDLFRECVRQSDVVGRLGGDEFGILIYSCSMEQALDLAEKIRSNVMRFEFLWDDKKFTIGASIGLSSIAPNTSTANEVMRAADSACYASKEAGRNQVTTASEETGILRSDAERIVQVSHLLEEGRSQLWRQPILALNEKFSGRDYFEIYMRLVDSDGSLIIPETIMPAVERYGLSPRLDRVVFDRSLAWIIDSREQLDQLAMCYININGPSLLDQDLVTHIYSEIKHSGVPPEKLCFQLSETAAITNLSSAREVIAQLGNVGCKFALDNFGSGVSSFSFLQGLPIDFVKIDGGLVTRLLEDKVCEEMVRSINRVSHQLNCTTVAKNVENSRTLDALESLAIDFAQGSYIGSPQPVDEP